MDKTIVLKPRMSEKAYATSLALNTYVFDVPATANKLVITSAIEAQFDVKVKDIKTTVIKGKVKKSYQKRHNPVNGKRANYKKAYVRLAEGSTINLFGEEEPTDKKTDKKTKKAEKKETK